MADPAPGSGSVIVNTLLAAAFAAWAGVVLWGIQMLNGRLTDIEKAVESVKAEMAAFKLSLSERITKAEAQAERVVDIEAEIRRIDRDGARAPNPEYRQAVDELSQRVRHLEGGKH